MFERLLARAQAIAESAARQNIERLVKREKPTDITLSPDDRTVRIEGKRLRMRMIENPWLRNFWR